jgi:haloalkane dehalogenase
LGQVLAVRANLVARSAFRYAVARPLPKEVAAAYFWPLRERAARLAAASLVRMVPDGPDHPTAATLRAFEAGYPKLEAKPMLVCWADGDPVLGPKLAERWGKAFPHARVQHVAGAGHFWQEDAPEAFEEPLLRFADED